LIEKLAEMMKTSIEAIKNIKINKITVWDSGQGENGNDFTDSFA
jgi:flotillin